MTFFPDIQLIATVIESRLKEAKERDDMKDETLIRLCEETAKWLSQTITVNPAAQMVPSYNAVLETARANHPEHFFLKVLKPLPTNGDDLVTVGEMLALFAQIRIVLESFRE